MYTAKFKNTLIDTILENLSNDNSFSLAVENSLSKLKIKKSDQKRIEVYYFPNNFQSFIEEYINRTNDELSELIKNKLPFKSLRDKIVYIIGERFKIISKFKNANRKIFRFCCLPQNLVFSQKMLFKISDEIWYLTSDKSLDFNFYSKRFILMNIYFATFIYWMNDESANFERTKTFLKKQINKTTIIGKYKNLLKNIIRKFNPQ